nr:MAG TPA: hypothetical protein [Caudoviricetes sp.]
MIMLMKTAAGEAPESSIRIVRVDGAIDLNLKEN